MELQHVLHNNIGEAAAGAENPRLKAAAHEFEASMMKELLKPLEHDSLFIEKEQTDSDDEQGSAGGIMSFGSQAMATAVSERGGFGIATLILNHFRASSPASPLDNPDPQLRPTAGTRDAKVLSFSADERT